MRYLCYIFILVGINSALAGSITQRLTFDKQDLKSTRIKGYELITLAGCDLTQRIGEPQLPVYVANILLPSGAKVEGVQITAVRRQFLPGEYLIYPVQPPQILSLKEQNIPFLEPKRSVYSSPEAYPKEVVEYAGSGNLSGYNIASFLVYPIQYLPLKRKLLFYSEINFTVRYTQAIGKESMVKPGRGYFPEVISKLVLNPEEIQQKEARSTLPEGNYQYVIITDDLCRPYFQPLADWKTKKGVPATIVTTSEIYSAYQGIDEQEKIRNFIIDARERWGTTWVLLGGDTNIIPARTAFAMDCQAGISPVENDIPCDLYYADLDGDWDANGNGIYGEVEDEVDLYPDVIVGRAPVENPAEAEAFVNKILTYEKNPPGDYQLNMLFAAEILWWSPYTDSGEGKDLIDELYIPPQFNIIKLYQSQGNENPSAVLNTINSGVNLINHDGHAWIHGMSVGAGGIGIADMNALKNGPRYPIFYSIGCWPAAFDHDCIAEHFVTNPQGGGVAFIGNSRYGWGSPGNPAFGYSDRFDQQFYRFLFAENLYHIGATLASAKAHFIPYSHQANVYRWHQYEVNLLGDPEMPIWTDTPGVLTVRYPRQLPVDSRSLTVTVSDGPIPIPDASVCVMKGDEVYCSGRTDESGQITFPVSPVSTGEMEITVTAQNYLPYEGTVTLFTEGPYVTVSNYTIDDGQGNGDGHINPAEGIILGITLKNNGNQDAYNLSAVLRTSDQMVMITDSTETFGTIPAGDSLTIHNAYSFQVDSTCPNGHVIYMELMVRDSPGHLWSNMLAPIVVTPILAFYHYWIDDTVTGDGDSIPEPGEDVRLILSLNNEGLGLAQDVTALLSCTDAYVSLSPSSGKFGDISPGEVKSCEFSLFIEEGCPIPYFPAIDLSITTAEGYCFSDSFAVTVGETGFADNMEGDRGWTHSGTPDLWHLSSHRSHSGSLSWYCGYDVTYHYADNMEASLVSPVFYLGPGSLLSFWCWYDVAIYGVDGVYVEVNDGSGWKTLDFIGSGGALNPLLMGVDWAEYRYDLSEYPPGTPLRLRFRFVSDESVWGEGVYIDDLKVGPAKPKQPITPPLPREYRLFQNYPNPFNRTTCIKYSLPYDAYVTLEIFNILGQKIRTLVAKIHKAGSYLVGWNGEDDQGRPLSSGVYLYRLRAQAIGRDEKFQDRKKMIFLR